MVINHNDIWLDILHEEAPNGGVVITDINDAMNGNNLFYVYDRNNLIEDIQEIVENFLEKGNTNGDYFGWLEAKQWAERKANDRKRAEEIAEAIINICAPRLYTDPRI